MVLITGLIPLFLSLNITAQNLTSAVWTGWVNIRQPVCIQRAGQALQFAKIPITEKRLWYVVGNAARLNVRIKCIADDNSKKVVNPNAVRILIDIEANGFATDTQRLNGLRTCIRQYVTTGKSTCWQTGTTGTTPGNFRTIAWTDTPASLRLWGGNGQRYIFYCPPNGRIRPIWGSISYTNNSSICTAAAHDGKIIRARGGNVMIELDTGPRFFTGRQRNGITSRQYQGQVRAYSFINAPANSNSPAVTIYGRTWNETESGWTGVWTRSGYTNIYSAVWTLGNQKVTALLTIQISGNRVYIDRTNNPPDGITCSYNGTLAANRKNVTGVYTCRNRNGVMFNNRPWQATINR